MKYNYEQILAFANKYVAKHTQEADEKARFPKESIDALKTHGYMGLLVPKEYGGQGLGLYEHALTIEALAQSCATTALSYMMHNVATMCIVLHGSDEMKASILPKIANGDVSLALAYSETATGTHFYQPQIALTKSNTQYLLNGTKSFVTSAGYVDYYLVLSNSLLENSLDNWLIDATKEGITIETEKWDGLGLRGNASAPLSFENILLNSTDRIGEEGSGQAQVFEVVAPFFIIGLSAVYSGVALAVSESITKHCMQRTYSDESALCSIESVQKDLALIYQKAQSAKHFTKAAALCASNGEEDALAQIIASRTHASQVSIEVATLAMKLGGGQAYAKRLDLDRLLRDALASQVMAPGVDVLSIWLGRAITKQPLL